MGRMKELHMELVDQGLSDEEIEQYAVDNLGADIPDRDFPNEACWYSHQDSSDFAEQYESLRLAADIDEWRLQGII